MPSDSATAIVPAVLQVLALPAADALTEAQTRGAVCVWHGGEKLTAETAVDLGEQTDPRWFPRACPACVADRAHRSLLVHGAVCEQCADEAAECPVGRGLYRLVRDYRR
ncbi:hypothetical protein AB0C59_13585 [Streptomyces sp. NPDC048664]|uniref:hypothetical protein n=1 Tax=Streptomyces sp. NPDC048664 TaxID=3154505 RepID=UPI0034305538